MRSKIIFRLCLILWLGVIFSASAGDVPTDVDGKTDAPTIGPPAPFAVAKEARFHFDPVVDGTVVDHEFIIENTGNAPLSIKSVKTSCGCTTADYTKRIAPGNSGIISIRGNTNGYGGRTFSKTITVYTNDPKHGQLRLSISGNVDSFALIKPKRVILRGAVGNDIQTRVAIIPLNKYPFNIVGSYAENLREKITFTLNKKENSYYLIVKNLMKDTGRYRGRIHLKTDNPVKPEIVISIFGVITDNRTSAG